MDYLGLLQRTDYYEITGNRMTSYCSTLGGGSINYWDGRKVSFNPTSPLCEMTAFVQVLDAKHRLNLLQQMYHFWRPDKVISKFHSHERSYIEEAKTIHNDTFVSCMDFHGETPVDLIVRLSGAASPDSHIRFEENMLIIEEVRPKDELMKDDAVGESRVFKVLGFNIECSCSIDGIRYDLEFPLNIDEDLSGIHEKHTNVVLTVAAADTEDEAITKFKSAMTDPAALFAARKREWEDYFEHNVPRFRCDNPVITKMYYFIYYMVKSNIYNFDHGYLKHLFESTGKFRLLPQWFWDSAFGAINEKWLNDLPLPRSSMSNTIEAQREDGMLPFSLCVDHFTYGERTWIQPFILPMAVWDYYLKSGDRQFIEKALPALIRFDEWMMQTRDTNGEDLVHLVLPGESGWDNSKRYVLHEHLVQDESPMIKENRFIQSPDFNTYVFLGRKIIAAVAGEIGKPEIAAEFDIKASRTENGIRSMWSDATGLFMDRFEDNHEQIGVRTPGGIIPMLAGIADDDQAERIARNLTDPELFWTEFPVATLDINDPDYNDTDEYFSYWNGRVWPQINWLIIEGLCRAGKHEVARELARLSVRMCSATGEAWCMENYHPRTGYPYFTHNIFNYVWGGIFNDILLRRIAGVQGNAPKDEVCVNPLLNEDINMLTVTGIRVGKHTINVHLEKRGDMTALEFTHVGEAPITLITSAGRMKVHNATINAEVTTFDAPHWLGMSAR